MEISQWNGGLVENYHRIEAWEKLWGGWCTKKVSWPHGVDLWKHIRRGWDTYSRYSWFKVGEGSKIKFWHNVWCGNWALKETFPQVYGLAMYSTHLLEGVEDKIFWCHSKIGKFSIHSFYKAMTTHGTKSFLWKSIGKQRHPSRQKNLYRRLPWRKLSL